MIKKLETNDILKIKDIEKTFPCDKTQYVQYLMSRVNDDKYYIVGNIEDNTLKGYAVFKHIYDPPISNWIIISDIWSVDHKNTLLLAEEGKKWAMSRGVKRGLVNVDDNHSEKYMNAFGLKKISNIYEWSI